MEIEGLRYYREEAKREARAIELRQIRDYEVRSVTAASAKRDRAEAERGVRSALLRSHADGKRREAVSAKGDGQKAPRHLLLKGSRDFDLPIGLGSSPAATNGTGNAAYAAAEYTEEDDAVDEAALREFAFILAKEDLIEHLEALVEMGCTHIEDLAAIDEKELVRMAPKVVHKRKLASLRKKYAA